MVLGNILGVGQYSLPSHLPKLSCNSKHYTQMTRGYIQIHGQSEWSEASFVQVLDDRLAEYMLNFIQIQIPYLVKLYGIIKLEGEEEEGKSWLVMGPVQTIKEFGKGALEVRASQHGSRTSPELSTDLQRVLRALIKIIPVIRSQNMFFGSYTSDDIFIDEGNLSLFFFERINNCEDDNDIKAVLNEFIRQDVSGWQFGDKACYVSHFIDEVLNEGTFQSKDHLHPALLSDTEAGFLALLAFTKATKRELSVTSTLEEFNNKFEDLNEKFHEDGIDWRKKCELNDLFYDILRTGGASYDTTVGSLYRYVRNIVVHINEYAKDEKKLMSMEDIGRYLVFLFPTLNCLIWEHYTLEELEVKGP